MALRKMLKRVCGALGLLMLLVSGTNAQDMQVGARIYREGVLGNGSDLVGVRPGGTGVVGRDAACIKCHRTSGMGSVEGNIRIPPISGKFLFPADGSMNIANTDGIRGHSLKYARGTYTESSMRRALNQGVNLQNRSLLLMPRFDLGDDDLRSLMDYLAQLSVEPSAGVSREIIRFASVITPDVSAERRDVFVKMLQAVVHAKNASTSPRKRYMTSAANFVTQSERKWEVDVWELKGDPSTWAEQLQGFYAEKPVFALLSGLSENTWAPMDDFCAREHVPCWFPTVKASALSGVGYGFHFNSGLQLDAKALVAYLADDENRKKQPVRQFFETGSSGALGAEALRPFAEALKLKVADVALADANDRKLDMALEKAKGSETLVLWVGGKNFFTPQRSRLSPKSRIYLMAPLWSDEELKAVPASWRSQVRVVYPYELPHMRSANITNLHVWLKLQNIPVVDEVMQSEVFFAFNLMNDTLQDMIDNLYRDYLVERTEDNMGKREAGKAEQESRDRRMLGAIGRAAVKSQKQLGSGSIAETNDMLAAQRQAFGAGDSTGTTVYPRLTLAPGQRFASRGAYVASYADLFEEPSTGSMPEWVVP